LQQVAAAVIIMASMSILAFYLIKNANTTGSDIALSEYIIPYGSRSQVILPDGTNIWLNSGSQIKYDRQFGLVTGLSTLKRAYFDVTESKKLPFIVNASGSNH